MAGEMEAPLLEPNGGGEEATAAVSAPVVLTDYEPVKSLEEVRSMFWIETIKLWRIAGPIICTIICNYGINSITNIFVGHIGELELSAVTISLSVIGTFSFGFMVICLFLSSTSFGCLLEYLHLIFSF